MTTFPGVTNIRERCLQLNQYHRRIYRAGGDTLRDEEALRQTAVATSILIDRMDQLFRVVEPDAANLSVFGHETRNLLLLACMEVEAALRAVLQANGYAANRFTTSDYVKLLPVLHLSAYELRLSVYPGVPPISPFASWDSACPTQSLPWYDAYNQTKHDREGNFKVATLRHAINAVAGAVILAYAQFGLHPILAQRFGIFTNSKIPECPETEWYLFLDDPPPEMDGSTGRYRRLSTPTWIHVDYPFPKGSLGVRSE